MQEAEQTVIIEQPVSGSNVALLQIMWCDYNRTQSTHDTMV